MLRRGWLPTLARLPSPRLDLNLLPCPKCSLVPRQLQRCLRWGLAHVAIESLLNQAAPEHQLGAALVQRMKFAECLAPGCGS
jgi:hypothetical protein